MLLAIDTSTHYVSVGAHDGERLLSERTWLANQEHTRTLLPSIQGVLESAGAGVQQLTCLAVALGPGSFNGLRVGLSTAKALALTIELPVVGIPTLEIVAEEYGLDLVTANAGRGQVYCWRRGTPANAVELMDGTAPDYVRHAGTLARLGWQRFRHGQTVDLARLEPLYVHPPQIHAAPRPPRPPRAARIASNTSLAAAI